VEVEQEPKARVRTVHQVNGESIDAVLYVATADRSEWNGTIDRAGAVHAVGAATGEGALSELDVQTLDLVKAALVQRTQKAAPG